MSHDFARLMREAEIDAEIERILAMTPEECLAEGIKEYGSEEAFHAAMNKMRDDMLAMVERVLNERTVSAPSLPDWRESDLTGG